MMEAGGERPVDVRVGRLHIRLAETPAEIKASQRLRYRVFCEEMTAKATSEMERVEREFDSFDEFCDHLLVFDHTRGEGPEAVVGSYRLMRREAASKRGQFYSVDEYELGKLLDYEGEILELGRSCVDAAYRKGTTMQVLWRGIAEYVFAHHIDLMFGCASLPGTEPDDLATQLSYLHHRHLAPPELRARAIADRYQTMDLLPDSAIDEAEAVKSLPPLIKGYLRLGGNVGDGAVVDADFGTTDVFIVLKTDLVTEKYYRHYAAGTDTGAKGASKPRKGREAASAPAGAEGDVTET